MARRPRAHERRAAYFGDQLAAATDPAARLAIAWNWLTAALARLEAVDAVKADAARTSLADQLAGVARDADPKRTTRR
ncbi:hypothetical protein [Nonomuraea endophytica]|uniref:hypothetical protein n=1 Tax=Nonomuraea endophytica TaxID=714136 RepID=UPI0037C6E8EE